MTVFIFLTVVQAIIAALLVTIILMQKSEVGGLGTTSGPAGFMSARGAADFMTRATAVLATAFVVLSVVLAALAVKTTATRTIDTSLAHTVPAQSGAALPIVPEPAASAPASPAAKPLPADPLSGAAKQ